MKPVVLISPNFTTLNDKYTLASYYTKAIHKSLGIPLLCPYENILDLDDILKNVSGVLLSGGGDIDAKFFNEETDDRATFINTYRDEFEIELVKKAIELDIPILAICRGMQVLNVALDGTINQHIDGHFKENDELIHKINIFENSIFEKLFNKSSFDVNSIHHQCIEKLGSNLLPIAYSDSVVEAVYHQNNFFVVGVQYHPERMYDTSIESKILFDEFIEKCKSYMIRRR